MRPEQWRQVTELAAQQYGLVTVGQMRAIGASRSTVSRAVVRGRLVPVRRSVLGVAGSPASVRRPLMAACLAAGRKVVVSHRSAADLHRLPGILPGAVELTSTGPPLRLNGARCHSTTCLAPDDVVPIGPFLVTNAARTVADLAGAGLHASLLARIVAHALRQRLCSTTDLERQLEGRRSGTEALRSLLRDHLGGDSHLEARWLRILAAAGLRPPVLQHQVVVGAGVLVLDFAWPQLRLGVEVDGWDVHRDRRVWDHDHDKVNAYLEAGWRVLFVTSRTRPADVVRQLRRFTSQNSTSR